MTLFKLNIALLNNQLDVVYEHNPHPNIINSKIILLFHEDGYYFIGSPVYIPVFKQTFYNPFIPELKELLEETGEINVSNQHAKFVDQLTEHSDRHTLLLKVRKFLREFLSDQFPSDKTLSDFNVLDILEDMHEDGDFQANYSTFFSFLDCARLASSENDSTITILQKGFEHPAAKLLLETIKSHLHESYFDRVEYYTTILPGQLRQLNFFPSLRYMWKLFSF